MKLVVQEAPALKNAIDSIVSLVEEGQFEIKEDGIYLKAMDPSQISMVSFHMPKSAFVEYSISAERKIGIDIKQLSDVLSRGKRSEKVELSIEEGRLAIKFYAEKRKRMFKIPLIEIGDGVSREPKIEYTSYAKIHADAFRETLKDAKLVSSHVKLLLENNSFFIEVRGENGDVKEEFEAGGGEVTEVKTEKGTRATFPLQYLEDMVKAASSASPIMINLETDRPMKLQYVVEGAKVTYYLAPRIETD